ncbi:DNA-packaging protein [Pseudomonas sp. NPDC090201]|uniref:DNA-packaging protein n=1 Tax=Pseudomonas sp. NPDC090201 TaxID=3364475 RepID=UPI00381E0749
MSAFKPLLGWLAVIAIVAVGLALNHSDGYRDGFAAAKALGDKALAEKDASHESEKRTAAENAAARLKAETDRLLAEHARGNQLAEQLGAKNTELRNVTDKLNKEIQRVTTLYRRTLGEQLEPLPPADFTTGFVRVWNSALGGSTAAVSVPATGTATSGADAPGAGAGAADDLIVGITRADLLTNHVRNAERYASCRAQLNTLIEWNTNNGRN